MASNSLQVGYEGKRTLKYQLLSISVKSKTDSYLQQVNLCDNPAQERERDDWWQQHSILTLGSLLSHQGRALPGNGLG